MAGGFPAALELSALDGANGFVLNGIDEYDRSGFAVSSAGDVNGDGFDDLVIGAYNADPAGKSKAGESYVVFGKPGPFNPSLELSSLDGTNGFVVNGIDGSDESGRSVSSAGDVNGDGFDDLLIGASYADPNGSHSGENYVVFGKAGPFTASLELSSLDGTNGFVINGIDAMDISGDYVNRAGDINGDGFDDLLIGAYGADPNSRGFAGESYAVFGKAGGFAANLELSSLNGTNGFVLNGIDASDYSGKSVSGAGDVNGDGFDDLVIDARHADPNGSNSGESYVLFGGDFTEAVTHAGDAGDNLLTGDAGANVMIGAQGDDVLVGAGGADVLRGGEGDDVLAVSDTAFGRIVGGTGTDTLRLDGSGITLDLTAIADNRIMQIERIDITGNSPNTLILNVGEVLNLSDHSNTLTVYATADDVINKGPGWTFTGMQIFDGTMSAVYTQGAATLIIAGQFELSSLLPANGGDGTAGFVLNGIDAGEASGWSVSGAGDINGDGFDDLLIGAPRSDPNGVDYAGESYVVFGKAGGFPASLELSSLDGTNGFVINGIKLYDWSGWSVSGAGDVNGDGFDDLLIGARDADGYAGESYVVFGKASGFAASLDLSLLDGTNGFVLGGIDAGDAAGWSVSGAGDVNGDGFDDLLIGAYRADPNGNKSGESYLVFGKAGGFAATLELSALDGTNGIVFNGIGELDHSGFSVSGAGDFNRDGFDDLVIGADWAPHFNPGGDVEVGESYLVFGKASGFAASLELSLLDGTNGFAIIGIDAVDRSGSSVSEAGDVNGDGFDDLLVGAPIADPNSNSGAGESYVVFGKPGPFAASLELSSLDGTNGFVLNGIDAGDNSGSSVSGAGDVNGDGFDDLLIGAWRADPNNINMTGESYIVFGKASEFGASLNLSSLDGTNGFVLIGIDEADRSGDSVSGAGDVNGDGFDDLILGAPGADPNGESYVVFGSGAAAELDFGDVPDPTYPTLLASDGARHTATGPTLGSNRDTEADGQPTAAADGDDTTGTPDDEDGLVNPAVDLALVEGVVPSVDVKVTNNTGSTATLYGWIDYNGDGVFDNATERASVPVPTGSTDVTVTLNNFLPVPSGSVESTYARFRLSTDAAAAEPTGAANDGEVEDYTVSIDEAPRVTNVWVSSQNWDSSFLTYLQTSGVGDATHGYAIPVGSSDQLKPLPWFHIDEVAIQFNEDVDVEEGDLGLMGVTVQQYGYADSGFSYDDEDYVATWTLDQLIDQPNKLLIDLGGVTDTASIALDGEWTDEASTYPSGDGTPGGDFQFRFNVLPGDADQSWWVTGPDWGRIRLQLGKLPGDPGYSILYDVDGSGWITGPDWGRARSRLGDQLPTGEPSPLPSVPAGMPGDRYASDLALALVLDRRADRVDPWNNRFGRSVWSEALLWVTKNLEHPNQDEKEEVPGTLLPACIDFSLLE